MRKTAFVSTVVMFLAAAGSALAQDAAAPATAQAEPAPADAAPAAEASASVSTDAAPEAEATAAAPAAAPEEEAASIPGWFRIDSDAVGLQLWAGATHDVGGIALATDMYVGIGPGGNFGEFDIGPAFTVADGAVVLTPMIGAAFCWNDKRACNLVPQFYAVGGFGPIYFESWWQLFLPSVFVEDASNTLYTRHFLTYNVIDDLGVGPAIEPTFGLNNDQDTLVSFPLGAIAKLNYGEGNTFFGFLGYEMIEDARAVLAGVEVDPTTGEVTDVTEERGLVGRLTFVKNW
jgi:hypothetical protein